MNKDPEYQLELHLAAKRLGISTHGDVEDSLIDFGVRKLSEWISAHKPQTLSALLKGIATSYQLEVVEIHSDQDVEELLRRIPPTREPALARVRHELDDNTDAVIFQRQNGAAFDMPYLAVINCQQNHRARRYFSTWHEVVHLLLDGNQLRFSFRKTNTKKKHPQEVLVDKIAGVLAFHPDLFEPVLLEELNATGKLTFAGVERIKELLAPEASSEATLYACLRHCEEPVCYVKARPGLKESEKRQVNDLLSPLDESGGPEAKLRVSKNSPSPAATKLGIRIHPNMQVPSESHVSKVYNGTTTTATARERLELWHTSSDGSIGSGPIEVEARRRWDEVECLLHFLPGARGVASKRQDKNRNHVRSLVE